jgi:hypothetical protein
MTAPFAHAAPLALAAAILFAPQLADARQTGLTVEEVKNGLRTASPEENGFVEDIIDRVNNASRPTNERLPAAMVQSTFQWARGKNSRHRFQYFRRALILRAARIGVRL